MFEKGRIWWSPFSIIYLLNSTILVFYSSSRFARPLPPYIYGRYILFTYILASILFIHSYFPVILSRFCIQSSLKSIAPYLYATTGTASVLTGEFQLECKLFLLLYSFCILFFIFWWSEPLHSSTLKYVYVASGFRSLWPFQHLTGFLPKTLSFLFQMLF